MVRGAIPSLDVHALWYGVQRHLVRSLDGAATLHQANRLIQRAVMKDCSAAAELRYFSEAYIWPCCCVSPALRGAPFYGFSRIFVTYGDLPSPPGAPREAAIMRREPLSKSLSAEKLSSQSPDVHFCTVHKTSKLDPCI